MLNLIQDLISFLGGSQNDQFTFVSL